MCLIHEAIGRVVFDPLERFFPGQDVILLPNGGGNSKGSNYRPNSYLRSSSADGFTQEILELSENEVIPFSSSSPTYYVLTELLSVCYHAISQVPTSEWVKASSVGIWGDGVVSYLLSLCIKSEFPNLELIIIGKHSGKLMLFSHADSFSIFCQKKTSLSQVDLAFEAVGGKSSEDAIDQILEVIKPCGSLCLLGVTDYPVRLNTRKILEKGLILRGSSRSLRIRTDAPEIEQRTTI